MRPDIREHIKPGEIYTGSQVIALAGIPRSSFYRFLREGKIQRHEREIDGRPVFLGHELLHALLAVKNDITSTVCFTKPRRGRPRKNI